MNAELGLERLTEVLDRYEDDQAKLGPLVPRSRRSEEEELVTNARRTLRKLLCQYPKKFVLSREETYAWLVQPFTESWAGVMTAEGASDLARVRRLLETGAELHRSHQKRLEIALWALAVVPSRDGSPRFAQSSLDRPSSPRLGAPGTLRA